jgi:hypothetical protein
MITFSPDKFGFYRVGERTTYSKFEALEWSKEPSQLEWHFNREVYDSVDWMKEPELDLWSMYKARARQIREAYDYVVLFYSGGSDSHNILHAWIEEGLKIDEIATTWNYQQTGYLQNHYNAEITNVVLPDIKRLQDSGLEFKFRLLEMAEFCMDLFPTWGTNFEYNINFHFSPNNPAKHLFRDKIQDYKDLIAAGKKVCFVWGKEKPFLRLDPTTDRHYVTFCDNVDNCVGPYVQRNYYKGWYDEFFYWTPDFPLIPVKQAHVILNFIKLADDPKFFIKEDRWQANGMSRKYGHLLDEVVKVLIYPKWSNDIFCNGKTRSFTYSARDKWFFESNVEQLPRFMDITNTYFNRIDPSDQKRINIYPVSSPHSPTYWIE